MDGWGLGKVASSDAIQNAKTPFVSSLYSKYPNTTLITCGEAVGLPDGQMGNSGTQFKMPKRHLFRLFIQSIQIQH